MHHSTPVIHKFGGAALADARAIRHIARLLVTLPHENIVVTVSAMATVTNRLFDLALRAVVDETESLAGFEQVRRHHQDAWTGIAGTAHLPPQILQLFDRAESVLRSVAGTQALTPRSLDAIVAVGEQAAAHLVIGALRYQGLAAGYVDAATLLYTDGRAGAAMPRMHPTADLLWDEVGALRESKRIPVMPGFIGRTEDGSVVTLGRGGTDLTATTVAAALDASEVVLWKDVPGFLTADPRIVPDARVIPVLHPREAAELAYYGAEVLHPRALIPVNDRDCVVRIKSFLDPDAEGTVIVGRPRQDQQPVRALSATHAHALLTLCGNGILGVPGVAARAFDALHDAGISVSLISQASSEHSICVAIPSECVQSARDALLHAFHTELTRGEVSTVTIRPAMTTIAIVGLGMAGHPGVAARLFAALAKRQINVVAIAQGSSELNISVVIDAAHTVAAQQAIHDEFQLGKIGGGAPAHRPDVPLADVILLGFGRIGRAFADMLVTRADPAHRVRLVGVIDRGGYVFDPAGLTPDHSLKLIAHKERGESVADSHGGITTDATTGVTHMLAHALTNPILVDTTAEDTTPLLASAISSGADLVLANKHPLGGPFAHAASLTALVKAHGRRLRHEATVGAGLPILDTIAKLTNTGDRILRIEGCPSGTMGYLFGELGRGHRFSEALRGAMALGYTEPDPRLDLSGIDVARKALILGRLVGFTGELDDVDTESLVSPDMMTVPLDDFLQTLEDHDERWVTRVAQARSRDAVLRYRVTVSRDAVAVGLVEVPLRSALGSLEGTDNQFMFVTERYHTNPLVITGPGAGPAVTAAGVLSDVLELARVYA